jgi:hypothetical protein
MVTRPSGADRAQGQFRQIQEIDVLPIRQILGFRQAATVDPVCIAVDFAVRKTKAISGGILCQAH